MLSLNGSPITNPFDLGIGWFKGLGATEASDKMDDDNGNGDDVNDKGKGKVAETTNGKQNKIKRSNSIYVRHEPSFTNGLHSRTPSTASMTTSSHSSTTQSDLQTQSYGHSPPLDATPKPSSRLGKGLPSADSHTFASAMVAIPTKDGHVLEFDPLLTSPGALDALVGITDSAKKQAREEMGRLIQATVDKWKIL
jgi:hypothetical protein